MMQTRHVSAGARVKILNPGPVPAWSEWDDDAQRTSTPVKKRLQQLFFKGDRKIVAEVVYVSNEALRDKMRSLGRVKLALRDPAGASLVVTADAANLKSA